MVYLMGGSGRNEDGVAETLQDAVAGDAVLFVEAGAQRPVRLPARVVEGFVVRREPLAALHGHHVEEVADAVGVLGLVDVPQGAGQLAGLAHPRPRHVVAAGVVDGPQRFCAQRNAASFLDRHAE